MTLTALLFQLGVEGLDIRKLRKRHHHVAPQPTNQPDPIRCTMRLLRRTSRSLKSYTSTVSLKPSRFGRQTSFSQRYPGGTASAHIFQPFRAPSRNPGQSSACCALHQNAPGAPTNKLLHYKSSSPPAQTMRAKSGRFYAARTGEIPALLWPDFETLFTRREPFSGDLKTARV